MKKFIFVFIILFSFSIQAGASSLSFDAPSRVDLGSQIEVKVLLDPEGVQVNSFEMGIGYDSQMLDFRGFKEGEGISLMWIEKPEALNGTIKMGAVVPGGVLGLYDPLAEDLKPIPVAVLLFNAKYPGEAVFDFKNAQVLKHDGKGTATDLDLSDLKVIINNTENKEVSTAETTNQDMNTADKTPPHPFEIILVDRISESNTPSMIFFEAEDTESGIKEYQIKDGWLASWREAQSPEVVRKGVFSKKLVVRAIDYGGNFRDQTISIDGLLPIQSWALLFLFIFLSGVLVFKLLK